MAGEKTVEQLKEELLAVQKELKAANEEITSLKNDLKSKDSEIETAIAENFKLQQQLEKAEDNLSNEPTVDVDGKEYRILHGGKGLENFGVFTPKDIQSNDELAKKLVEIGFGGLELISND